MAESAGGGTAMPRPTASSQKSFARKKNNSFSECLKAPFRLLRRARDIYVKSLGGCAGAGGGARGGGYAAGVVALMPRGRSRSAFGQSIRFGSGEDDFRDLVRASSKVSAAAAAEVVVTRSRSAPVIERIEEEGEEDEVLERSQSCAVPAAAVGGRVVVRR